MGKLAVAGALAGFGKGLTEEVQNTRNTQKMEFEASKEARLRELEHGYQQASAKQGQQFQQEQQGREFTQQAKLHAADSEARTAPEYAKLATEMHEGSANRASREKIAGMQAGSRGSSSKTAPRWDFKSTPATDVATPTGMIHTPAQTIVNDKLGKFGTLTQDTREYQAIDPVSGKSVTQYENNFYPPGRNAKNTRRAKSEATDFLIQNPATAQAFISQYGYLPAAFIAAQNSQMAISQSTSQQTSSDEENDQ